MSALSNFIHRKGYFGDQIKRQRHPGSQTVGIDEQIVRAYIQEQEKFELCH